MRKIGLILFLFTFVLAGCSIDRDGEVPGEDGLTPAFQITKIDNGTEVLVYYDINGDGFYNSDIDIFVSVFEILNGQDGAPGLDGADGVAGLDGVDGEPGQDGADGEPGQDGENGQDGQNGISCWDLNGDGVKDVAEDINGDGKWDALDCQGVTTVTVCHREGKKRYTLTLTFPEYVKHIFTKHGGKSYECDSFGPCK